MQIFICAVTCYSDTEFMLSGSRVIRRPRIFNYPDHSMVAIYDYRGLPGNPTNVFALTLSYNSGYHWVEVPFL